MSHFSFTKGYKSGVVKGIDGKGHWDVTAENLYIWPLQTILDHPFPFLTQQKPNSNDFTPSANCH